jgi:hypothetical protein
MGLAGVTQQRAVVHNGGLKCRRRRRWEPVDFAIPVSGQSLTRPEWTALWQRFSSFSSKRRRSERGGATDYG